jgi:hypothetical protein
MMTSRSIVSLALCGFVVSSCMFADTSSYKPVSPSELNSDPAQYNGRTVVVRGFIKLAPEGHVLYESQTLDAEFASKVDAGGRFDAKSYRKYCLTIANPDFFYGYKASLNGQTVVIQGKFIDDYLDGNSVDLGACPLPTAIIIDEENFKQRYKKLLNAD